MNETVDYVAVYHLAEDAKADCDDTSEEIVAYNDPNKYTIEEEKNGWGRLKSEIGWINLKYTVKV